jgi:RNA-binding protein
MLTPKQRQFLKAQAHHLKPAVHIGKGGLTDALATELDLMLESLELMKIKLNQNTSEELETAIAGLQAKVEGIEHVWTIGKTILVFRSSRNKPTSYALPH